MESRIFFFVAQIGHSEGETLPLVEVPTKITRFVWGKRSRRWPLMRDRRPGIWEGKASLRHPGDGWTSLLRLRGWLGLEQKNIPGHHGGGQRKPFLSKITPKNLEKWSKLTDIFFKWVETQLLTSIVPIKHWKHLSRVTSPWMWIGRKMSWCGKHCELWKLDRDFGS